MKKLVLFIPIMTVFLFLSISISQASADSDSVNVSNNEGKSYRAQILVQDEKIYSAWTDKSPGNADTFFARSITCTRGCIAFLMKRDTTSYRNHFFLRFRKVG